MAFPKRKKEPFRLTTDYYHGDHKPTNAGNRNFMPLTGPRLERLQEPDRKRPIYGSHQAMYLGAIFLGLRLTAGWTSDQACKILETHLYPSLNGQNLLAPATMKKRGWIELLEKSAPAFFHRRGVGDVLHAYINNKDLTPLYDPEIFQINESDLPVTTRKNKLQEYFGLKELKGKHTRPLWQGAIEKNDEDSPNPIEPQSQIQAVAQELLFHKEETRKKWFDLSYARREESIKNQEKLIQAALDTGTTTLEKLWTVCAQALLIEAAQTTNIKKTKPSRSLSVKELIKKQTQTMAATRQTEPLYRRFKHLTNWMPHA